LISLKTFSRPAGQPFVAVQHINTFKCTLLILMKLQRSVNNLCS